MPYVTRDDEGRITDVQEHATAIVREEVSVRDPELLAYLNAQANGGRSHAEIRAELEASDLELIRVIEDVITVLIDKRVFMLTELPAAAQEKLARRYNLRSKLSDLSGIISEHEDIMLP